MVISVGLIVPIGAIFLSFLIDYGLLELVGVIMQPVMRRIWKTPGKSAIDAGFSTVSVTFMISVAKTLDLMPFWGAYFWTTIVITFIVTAITARIYPIKGMLHKNDLTSNENVLIKDKENIKKPKLRTAYEKGVKVCAVAEPILVNIKSNFVAGFLMTMSILASIMSVGTLGLILAKYTPFFDVLGYLFYPVAWATKIPEPLEFSRAVASSLAEMFLPALLLKDASLISRFVAGIVSISSILFFSASIPCILSTGIPIKIKDLIIIWIERVFLTILIAAPITYVLLYFEIISS